MVQLNKVVDLCLRIVGIEVIPRRIGMTTIDPVILLSPVETEDERTKAQNYEDTSNNTNYESNISLLLIIGARAVSSIQLSLVSILLAKGILVLVVFIALRVLLPTLEASKLLLLPLLCPKLSLLLPIWVLTLLTKLLLLVLTLALG